MEFVRHVRMRGKDVILEKHLFSLILEEVLLLINLILHATSLKNRYG